MYLVCTSRQIHFPSTTLHLHVHVHDDEDDHAYDYVDDVTNEERLL
jgi:hypothetical protein